MEGRVTEFIETHVFTSWLCQTLTDEQYREFQLKLLLQPELGDVIPGGGGLRKVRWKLPGKGKGKRGGLRIIYYWIDDEDLIILLFGYEKSVQGDLTPKQIRILRDLVERMLK